MATPTTFICPTTGVTIALDDAHVLSTHRSATGGVAYARCACGGLAVVTTQGGTGPWTLVAHSSGSTVADTADHARSA